MGPSITKSDVTDTQLVKNIKTTVFRAFNYYCDKLAIDLGNEVNITTQ